MMVPLGFPWEALAARRANGLPLPEEFEREAARQEVAHQDPPIPGLDDHLVPWYRHMPPRSPIVRAPQRPITDVDGKRINLGDTVLYAGVSRLRRAVVVGIRERSRWDGRPFQVEVLVKQLDARGTVTILHHPQRVLVLKEAK